MEIGAILTGANPTKFVIVGYEQEELTTDSVLLQNLSVLISEVYK